MDGDCPMRAKKMLWFRIWLDDEMEIRRMGLGWMSGIRGGNNNNNNNNNNNKYHHHESGGLVL
jgi:hypothetical protein